MCEQVQVALWARLGDSLNELPAPLQSVMTSAATRFLNGDGNLDFVDLPESPDPRMFLVETGQDNAFVVERLDHSVVLLYAGPHDKALEWAAGKYIEVNAVNGTLSLRKTVQPTEIGLFADVSDEDLVRLGVPPENLTAVRQVRDADSLGNLQAILPETAFALLEWYAHGDELVDLLDLADEQVPGMEPKVQRYDPDDVEGALENPTLATQAQFVVVQNEDELLRMMSEPLEKWRVYLRPDQRRIVERTCKGPARTLGGAGTGKTVVAMHRAKHLASLSSEGDRILFTTYSRNLAGDIRANLAKICRPEELARIEVTNLDAWVAKYFREQDFDTRLVYGAEVASLWEEAIRRTASPEQGSPTLAQFYEEEWDRVVMPQEALTKDKYLKASRKGRGTRLSRRQRMEVWNVLEAYQNLLKERKVRDINMAMYECARLLESDSMPKYSHVIVDEGQDFGNSAYRLIRAIAGSGNRENDIFIVGDAHQRIYRNRPTLSQAGIDVRGRASILKTNYRTTEETRRYAFAVLEGTTFDDLDEGEDLGDGCRSLTHGVPPQLKGFRTFPNEVAHIRNEIKKLREAGVRAGDICIVARTNDLARKYKEKLQEEGIVCYEIRQESEDNRSNPGVRIATMHRVKGLEFRHVFIVGAEADILPLRGLSGEDRISEEERLTREKCLLYVALSRAQQTVHVTWNGKKSPLLPAASKDAE